MLEGVPRRVCMQVGGRCFRSAVHGTSPLVAPPSPRPAVDHAHHQHRKGTANKGEGGLSRVRCAAKCARTHTRTHTHTRAAGAGASGDARWAPAGAYLLSPPKAAGRPLPSDMPPISPPPPPPPGGAGGMNGDEPLHTVQEASECVRVCARESTRERERERERARARVCARARWRGTVYGGSAWAGAGAGLVKPDVEETTAKRCKEVPLVRDPRARRARRRAARCIKH